MAHPKSKNGVSFIVTLFNKEKFIERVLRGIIDQKLSVPSEIIICDDGSTDQSTQIALNVIEQTPSISWNYFRIENSGPAIATNLAAKRARYHTLKLVDADDYLPPLATEHLFQALEQREDASLIFGGFQDVETEDWFDLPSKTDWPDPSAASVSFYPIDNLYRRMTFGPTCMLIKTDKFIESGGCDEDIFIQDYSLALNLSLVGAIYQSSLPISYAPTLVANRLNGTVQLYHDLNLAILNHLKRASLSPARARFLAARCVGRAIKFHRRHINTDAMIRARFDYLALKLALSSEPELAISRSLALFGTVRRAISAT